jgi:outer membrane protein assembly factor BamB
MNLGSAVYAIAGDGSVHVLNPQTGEDLSPPVKLLAPGAKVVGSVLVDGVLYAATADKCGNVPNGVWAVDLVTDPKTVASWPTRGGSVVGHAAPTLGADGTVYVATGDGDIAALRPKTLTLKDSFAAGSPFTTAPIAFEYRGREMIVAANKDGRLYVMDGASLTSPLVKSGQFTAAASDAGPALASWEDPDGTRWIVAASPGPLAAETKFPGTNGAVTNGSIVAFKLADQNGALSVQPAWTSRDISAPTSPIVVNGVVFALAAGGPRTGSAVLYALDGATGKELWNSGSAMASFVHSGGLSAGDGQVYVPTYDNTLYAFGIPLEH